MAWSQDRVYRLVRKNGGSHREAQFLASVVPGESGGRLNIENSIGAFGLFQIYDGKPGAAARLRGRPNRQAKEALGKLRSQGKGAWAASRGSWQPYRGSGGKGFKGASNRGSPGGRLPGTLTGHLRTVPGVDRSAERQQLRLSYLGKSKMPSQGSLLNLASQLRTIQDTPSSQVYDIKRQRGKAVGGISGGGGGRGYPHGVGAHGTPNLLIHIGHLAQKMGLHVGENPNFGGVSPVHAPGSYHYRNEAVDVSGDPKVMARFAKVVQRRYGRHLAELIHNSPFGAFAVKHGKRVNPSFYSGVWAGHRNHVHVAVSKGGRGAA